MSIPEIQSGDYYENAHGDGVTIEGYDAETDVVSYHSDETGLSLTAPGEIFFAGMTEAKRPRKKS